jgi:hypothetical protein
VYCSTKHTALLLLQACSFLLSCLASVHVFCSIRDTQSDSANMFRSSQVRLVDLHLLLLLAGT